MKNPIQCDRCGISDSIPRTFRGYGFGKIGYFLCHFCALKWEQLIRDKKHNKQFHEKNWQEYANKLLIKFVIRGDESEKVEFT